MKAIKLLTIIMVFACNMQIGFAQTKGTTTLDAIATLADIDSAVRDAAKEPLCYLKDDAEWFTANNQMKGKRGDDKLANNLLRSCQQQLYDKLSKSVKQVTTGYFDQMDIDGNSKAAEHIEGASLTAVEQFINTTESYCQKQEFFVDNNGNVYREDIILYMSIRVSKRDIVDAMVNAINNDAASNVRVNEKEFRESALEVFEKEKPQE